MKTIITRKSGKQSRVRNFEAKVLIALGLADEVVAVKAPKPAPEPVRVKRTYQRRDMTAQAPSAPEVYRWSDRVVKVDGETE